MKRYIALLLALFMCISTTVSAAEVVPSVGDKVENPALNLPESYDYVMQNGYVEIEAEDFACDSYMKKISSDAYSGGVAVQANNSVSNANGDAVSKPSMSTAFQVEESGTYYVWTRVKIGSASNDSVFCAFNTDMYLAVYYTGYDKDCYWFKVATAMLPEGVATLDFKYRENGYILDKVIVTNDSAFHPEGMDDVPTGTTSLEGIYPEPEIKPISGHPRLFLTEEYLPKFKENIKSQELSGMFEELQGYANEVIDCKLEKKTSGNMSNALLVKIQARAMMYALGLVDEEHAKQTISHMRDYFDTVIYPNISDITRQMGQTMVTGAIVYDWCYDCLSQEDKEYFITMFKYTSSIKEIGYPPTNMRAISGHAGEGEIMCDLIAAGVACYDEDPEIYNLAAGRFFDEFVVSRKVFNATGNHPIGNAYGHTRFQWETTADLIFTRMGYENTLGENMAKVPYKWIYGRLPMGLWFKDGDDYLYSSNKKYVYSTNDSWTMGIPGNLYDDPYLRQQYLVDLNVNQYRLYDYALSVLTILFAEPGQEAKFQDDLPLSYASSYPLTSLTARTSWQMGLEAPTAMAYVNAREKTLDDHNHMDIGSFQIYYKGNLAMVCLVSASAFAETVTYDAVAYTKVHTNADDGFAKDGSDRIVKGLSINSDNSTTTTYHKMGSITSDENDQVVQLTNYGGDGKKKDAYLQTPDFGAVATGNQSIGRTVVFEFDEMFGDFNAIDSVGTVHYYTGDNQKQAVGILYTNTDGELYMNYYQNDNGTITQKKNQIIQKLNLRQWYRFRYVIQTDTSTLSVYVDNEKVLTDAPIYTSAIKGVRYFYRNVNPPSNGGKEHTIYIDNVKSYALAKCYSKEVKLYDANGVESADGRLPVENGKIGVTFSAVMDASTLTAENLSLTAPDGSAAAFTSSYDAEAKTLYLLPADTLQFDTEYALALSGVKTQYGGEAMDTAAVAVKTEKKPFCIDAYSVQKNGNALTVSVTVRNKHAEDRQALLGAGVYDENSMYGFATTEVSGTEKSKIYALTLPEGEYPEDYKVEIYLFDHEGKFEALDMVVSSES